MARPRKETFEVMRLRILDAARHVMIQKGYQDFRMGDVAHAANLASGTLYLYFKDKIDLSAGVFIDLLDRIDRKMRAALEQKGGLACIRQMVYEGLAFIDHHQDFLFQFTGEHPALMASESGRKLRNRFAAHLKILGQAIQRAVREGELRPCKLEFASIHLSFLIRMFMIDKIVHQKKGPLSARTNELMDLFLNGLGPKKK